MPSLKARVNLVESEVSEMKNAFAGVKGELRGLKFAALGLYFPAILGLLALVVKLFER